MKIVHFFGQLVSSLIELKGTYRVHGVQMPVDKRIMSVTVTTAIFGKTYEKAEALAIAHYIKSNDRVLELGGGIGLISTIAAKKAFQGTVVTVEANPKLIPFIKKVHRLNNVKVETVNAVVTAEKTPDKFKFYVRRYFWGSSLSPEPNDYSEVISVESVTIDELVALHKPTILIVDIEGGEIGLMSGNWMKEIRVITMEVHPNLTGHNSVQKMMDFLKSKKFQVSLNGNMLTAASY